MKFTGHADYKSMKPYIAEKAKTMDFFVVRAKKNLQYKRRFALTF